MRRRLALAIVVLLALAGLAVLALPRLVDTVALRAWVAQMAGHALGRPVQFTSLTVRALPLPTIQLRGVQVADDPAFGSTPFLTAAETRIRVRLWPLLRGRVEVTDVTVSDLRVRVVEDAAGRFNVATLGVAVPGASAPPRPAPPRSPSGAPAGVLAPRVRVVDGSVRYQRLGARPAEGGASRITATLSHDAPGGPVHVRGEALIDPGGARVALRDAVVALVAGRPLAEAAVSGVIELDASDVSPIIARALPSPEVQGAARGRLQLAGTLGRPRAVGEIALDRAALVEERRRCGEPPRRRLALDKVSVPLAVTPPSLDSQPVTARVAGGQVSLRATVQLDRGPAVAVRDLHVQGVEAGAILVDYLCQPWAVQGPLELTGDLTFQGPNYAGSASGAGRLRVGRGKLTGRDVTGVVEEVLAMTGTVASLVVPERRRPDIAPLDFNSITLSYAVAAGVVRTDDLLYEARGFRITGTGTYALADGRVQLDATFTQGDNTVRARIAGLPGSLRVTPTSVRIREGRDLRRLLDQLLR